MLQCGAVQTGDDKRGGSGGKWQQSSNEQISLTASHDFNATGVEVIGFMSMKDVSYYHR